MLTYELNNFQLKFQDKGGLQIPALIKFRVSLGPKKLFGIEKGLTRAAFAGFGKTTDVLIDFRKGRQGALNILEKDDFKGQHKVAEFTNPSDLFVHKEYDVSLTGNILELQFQCDSRRSFGGFLYLARYLIPASLSLELWEPVYVEEMSGLCNDRCFNVRIQDYSSFVTIIRPGDVEKWTATAFKNLEIIRFAQSTRLKAALHYYHVARRLVEVGDNIWEFVAETFLNYCKVLEALFGNSRDIIRDQMKLLGYTDEQIESQFIPITLLRNHFDIAHVRLSNPKGIDTPTISKYILILESRVGQLIKTVLEKSHSGEYEPLPEEGPLEYDSRHQKEWDEINENVRKAFFGTQPENNQRPENRLSGLFQ